MCVLIVQSDVGYSSHQNTKALRELSPNFREIRKLCATFELETIQKRFANHSWLLQPAMNHDVLHLPYSLLPHPSCFPSIPSCFFLASSSLLVAAGSSLMALRSMFLYPSSSLFSLACCFNSKSNASFRRCVRFVFHFRFVCVVVFAFVSLLFRFRFVLVSFSFLVFGFRS